VITIQGRPELVDRERERAGLRGLVTSGRKQLAIVYGRRQIGKTHLLSHAWPDTRIFYFLAAALTPDLNRQDLLRELSAWSGRTLDPSDYPTWRTVFREIASLAADDPLVVVLDEFQYLLDPDAAGAGGALTSQLVAVWDRLPATTPLTLVLSGSEVSVMAHLHGGGEPLYGRVTWSAELAPFDYRDAARMAPWLPLRDRIALYGIFGGTPRYLAVLRDGETLSDAAARTFISPHGEVHLQLLTLIEQEKGIRQPAEYRAVLTAVATGQTLLNEIAQTTGLEEHVARRALQVLNDLDLVRAERNFGAGARAPFRYRISDNAVRFWHHFLVPQRSRIATTEPTAFWAARIAPQLNTYLGATLEAVARDAYRRYHDRWGLPEAREWGRWEGTDRNRESVELDIVARLDDGRLLVGEVKWSSRAYGPALHTSVREKLARLAVSGQRWANEADDAAYLYVSAAGFAPEIVSFAAAERRITLLDLADLFPDGG
jgi:AAA+ ATPase superfamily predicted ATPase